MIAFFDLDQTLIPYDTQALFCHFILKRHPWRRAYLASFLPVLPAAGLKLVGSRGLKRMFLNYLWRMKPEQLNAEVNAFVTERVMPLLYPEVVRELKTHQERGLVTVLNTASPDIYAREIARRLGFDHCFATRVGLARDKRVPFAPRIVGTNNKHAAKLVAMADLLPAHGPWPIPGSYAYSDSHADLPMLRLAEFPVMVHPTKKLAAEGQAKGWRLLEPPRPFASKGQHRWHTLRHVLGL